MDWILSRMSLQDVTLIVRPRRSVGYEVVVYTVGAQLGTLAIRGFASNIPMLLRDESCLP
jgi:hypothetical protein